MTDMRAARRALFSLPTSLPPKPSEAQRLAIAQAINPKALALTILPTEKCNFRCTYCYESFEIGRMDPGTVTAVKTLISSRMGDLDHLSISWFGGEPLAASDIMLDIAGHAQQECSAHGVQFLPGDTTTNGALLTAGLLGDLVQRNQRTFQISLDGWMDGHDATRRSGSGGGTFDSVWKSLLMIRDSAHEVHVTLRIHQTRNNRDSVLELSRHIVAQFGGDKRFSVFLKAIENLGGPNAAAIESLDAAERVSYTAALKHALAGMPGTTYDEVLQAGTAVCYASKPNSLIIRANGRLAKCTVAFEDPRNDVGCVRADGTLQIENSKLAYWFRGLYSRDKDALACPAHVYPHEADYGSKRVIPIAEAV